MGQLHKKFEDYQVKELICRYLAKEIERNYIQEILGIGKTRFFALEGLHKSRYPRTEVRGTLPLRVFSYSP